MSKDGLDITEDQFEVDKPSILLLCEWATSKMRHGKHRALIAASVIRLRQVYVTEKIAEDNAQDEVKVETFVISKVHTSSKSFF